MLDEFYRVAFREKLYATIDDLQADLDVWMREFNGARPHQGKWCFGKTPCRRSFTPCPWRERNPYRSPRLTNPPPHEQQRPALAVGQIK